METKSVQSVTFYCNGKTAWSDSNSVYYRSSKEEKLAFAKYVTMLNEAAIKELEMENKNV